MKAYKAHMARRWRRGSKRNPAWKFDPARRLIRRQKA
jgi:hypothetical protein